MFMVLDSMYGSVWDVLAMELLEFLKVELSRSRAFPKVVFCLTTIFFQN